MKKSNKFFELLIGGGIGVLVGIVMIAMFMYAETQEVSFIKVSLFLVLSFIVQIAIHEMGHLIGGLLSGYQFLSYRLFSLAIVLENKKIRVIKQKVPGTLGQCLMIPPVKMEEFSFKLYLLGGVLLNVLASLFGMIWFSYSPVFVLIFALIGFFFALTNGIPNGFNDGSTYKIASSSKRYQELLYKQLDINGKLFKGQTFIDLPKNYVESNNFETSDVNYFDDFESFLEIGYYSEKKELDKVVILLEKLWQRKADMIMPYQLELKKEMLFFLLLTKKEDKRIEDLIMDKSLNRYLENSQISNMRVKAAKEYYYHHSKEEALLLIDKGIAMKNKVSSQGEYLIELDMLLWLKENEIETLTSNND